MFKVINSMKSYIRDFKDPYSGNPPSWFLSFVYCTMIFQIPYSIVAVVAFLRG